MPTAHLSAEVACWRCWPTAYLLSQHQAGEQESSAEIPAIGKSWPELLHGENAILVQPGDVAELVSAIEMVASDAELRGRLAQGAAAIAQFFSWTRIAEAHAALYNRLTQSSEVD